MGWERVQKVNLPYHREDKIIPADRQNKMHSSLALDSF